MNGHYCHIAAHLDPFNDRSSYTHTLLLHTVWGKIKLKWFTIVCTSEQHLQVHLNKLEYGEKVFFLVTFQKVKLIHFRFVTCKVKHFKSCCFNFDDYSLQLMKVKNQYIKILEYLHLSFNK